eukprot:gnl/TRDRNA2_/TRDRNA2_175232_c0_seq1.p1 gnl/TRDRNA2_/TRDRNA2_175232_c0~~gnl/TRDRNA2_/TRDRNA2_175232_c0_seq1.p1  ORF type:complete len:343 (-),score=25.50 gnl/TRDRNA2_/TRDRNA2_175232_c0_seq1:174-1118(-)
MLSRALSWVKNTFSRIKELSTTPQGVDGIAIDNAAGHVYVTAMGIPWENDGAIFRLNLDGSGRTIIVPKGKTWTPKQIKLEPTSGQLYWSDREGMRVMRAKLDGTNLETLVTTGRGAFDRMDVSKHCVGIAVDETRKQVYWSQKGKGGDGSIRRASLTIPNGEGPESRSDIEVLFEKLPMPIDLQLDLKNRKLYWTDRSDGTVNRASMDTPRNREVLISGLAEPIGIVLDLEVPEMFVTELGRQGRIVRANLDGSNRCDLPSPVGRGFQTGIDLARRSMGYTDLLGLWNMQISPPSSTSVSGSPHLLPNQSQRP